MKLRTLTALLSTGALALTLAGCGESDKDDDTGGDSDTDTVDEDEDEEEEEEDEDEEVEEDDYLEPYAVYIYGRFTLNEDLELEAVTYDGAEQEGFVYVVVANEDWTGDLDDADNACLSAFSLTSTLATDATGYDGFNSTAWATDLSIDAYTGSSERCEDIDPDSNWAGLAPLSGYNWAAGFGPLGDDPLGLEAWFDADFAEYEASLGTGYAGAYAIDAEDGAFTADNTIPVGYAITFDVERVSDGTIGYVEDAANPGYLVLKDTGGAADPAMSHVSMGVYTGFDASAF